MSLGTPSPREGEGLFRLVADSLPLLVWISGSDKRGTSFNKSWLDDGQSGRGFSPCRWSKVSY